MPLTMQLWAGLGCIGQLNIEPQILTLTIKRCHIETTKILCGQLNVRCTTCRRFD